MVAGWRTAALVGWLAWLGGCTPAPDEVEEEPAEPDPGDCSTEAQNQFVHDVLRQYYLWNDELEPMDPSSFESPKALLSKARVEVDRWSYITKKSTSDAWYMEGKFLGLGIRTQRDEDANLWVAQVYPGSSSEAAGLARGDMITMVSGMTVAEVDEQDGWGVAWGEDAPGVQVPIQVQRPDGKLHDTTVTRDWISIVTVPAYDVFEVDGRTVGYLAFQSFVEPGYAELNAAFAQLKEAGVEALVIDLRYNGGGLLAVARHFASLMVADLVGETMYARTHNADQAEKDRDHEFKELDSAVSVDRVVFITAARTKSASELVINALVPYVDVALVGTATGGKPVGMKDWDFCGQIMWPITFRLVNSEGAGDYYEGMTPDCGADDDLLHPLGDPAEASLAEALTVAASGECSAASSRHTGERMRPDPPLPGLRDVIGAI